MHGLRRPFVIPATIRGGNRRYRQNLRVRNVRPRRSISVSITTNACIIHEAFIGSSWLR